MVITNIRAEHARDIAMLHIEGIRTGFISSLGVNFVASLYKAIAQTESSFGFIVEEDGSILGFVALCTNLNRLYKSVLLRHAHTLPVLLAGKIFSFRQLRNTLETLFYPRRTKKMDLPSAELLSIVVAEKERRKGLATDLIQKSFAECSLRAIEQVKVLVGASNRPANRLYIKCGFKVADQINSHGVLSNIYIAQTHSVLKKLAAEELVLPEKRRPAKPEIIAVPGKGVTDDRIQAKTTDE